MNDESSTLCFLMYIPPFPSIVIHRDLLYTTLYQPYYAVFVCNSHQPIDDLTIQYILSCILQVMFICLTDNRKFSFNVQL